MVIPLTIHSIFRAILAGNLVEITGKSTKELFCFRLDFRRFQSSTKNLHVVNEIVDVVVIWLFTSKDAVPNENIWTLLFYVSELTWRTELIF